MGGNNIFKRFLFVQIICVVMVYLIIGCRLIEALGILEVDFSFVDGLVLGQKTAEVFDGDIKHPMMPKVQAEGTGSVDINHATAKELDTLPGIGKTKALLIIEQRDKMGGFSTLRDIVCTDKVGEATFEAIKPYIKISEYTGRLNEEL